MAALLAVGLADEWAVAMAELRAEQMAGKSDMKLAASTVASTVDWSVAQKAVSSVDLWENKTAEKKVEQLDYWTAVQTAVWMAVLLADLMVVELGLTKVDSKVDERVDL